MDVEKIWFEERGQSVSRGQMFKPFWREHPGQTLVLLLKKGGGGIAYSEEFIFIPIMMLIGLEFKTFIGSK